MRNQPRDYYEERAKANDFYCRYVVPVMMVVGVLIVAYAAWVAQ